MAMKNAMNDISMKITIFLLFSVFILSLSYADEVPSNNISSDNVECAVYFTGVGCPHCARADPVVLQQTLRSHPNLIVIEYEVYQTRGNVNILSIYSDQYNSSPKIPQIFLPNKIILGDQPIILGIEKALADVPNSNCLLINGQQQTFDNIDLNTLPGKPNIWRDTKILIRSGDGETSDTILKQLLNSTSCDIKYVLNNNSVNYTIISPVKVSLSGKDLEFDNAVMLDGWIFQWNGEGLNGSVENVNISNDGIMVIPELTIAKVISLAAVDAVNPCALAVLTLMLIAILTYNPTNKHKVLLAGFAFSISVFIMYFFYGLVIIRFFQVVQMLTSIKLYLHYGLAIAAMILGLLNIKDFIHYKPGGLGTEMPMMLRPTVKKLISGVTSPKGAFVVGLFVTLFLLPCTIGPYVIAGGLLSALEIIHTIPWLLLYNVIFILPMIGITIIIYLGMAEIEDVSGWKDKHIRKLHLISGLIMLLLGIGMLLGVV